MSAGAQPGDTGSAPALAQLAPILSAGGPGLARLLGRAERRMAEIADGHGPELGRHATHTLTAGGKRLRPMLVFLAGGAGRCADSEGPKAGADSKGPTAGADSGALVSAGVAVELVHMATLVHDDVLDRATLRRGRPTVYRTGGRESATATGDLLFSRAFAELAATGVAAAVRAVSVASSALAEGELRQRADAWSDSVTPERYLERCELKTARLFEAACRLGALLGEPGAAAADALGAFGLRIGLAFQILDDVLDVSGPAERTGKRRGTDLLDGTITLPLILARGRDPYLRDLDLRALTSDSTVDAVCERITLTGALEDATQIALGHVGDAKARLDGLELPAGAREALDLVADGVVERYA